MWCVLPTMPTNVANGNIELDSAASIRMTFLFSWPLCIGAVAVVAAVTTSDHMQLIVLSICLLVALHICWCIIYALSYFVCLLEKRTRCCILHRLHYLYDMNGRWGANMERYASLGFYTSGRIYNNKVWPINANSCIFLSDHTFIEMQHFASFYFIINFFEFWFNAHATDFETNEAGRISR